MNRLNKRGTRIVVWGIPLSTVEVSDLDATTFTQKLRPIRKLENHLYKLPPIPIFDNLYKILSCDKESNAFSNSYTTLPIYVLCHLNLSTAWYQITFRSISSFLLSFKCINHEFLLKKIGNWCSLKRNTQWKKPLTTPSSYNKVQFRNFFWFIYHMDWLEHHIRHIFSGVELQK